jgi:ubiquitin carboxyl-terminal hydrolase L3
MASQPEAADPGASAPSFIPLEANPEVMSNLLHNLGLSSALQIHDVYSMTDPDLLAFVPRPALALLLVFPVSAAYESHRLAEDATADEYNGHGVDEPVVWFRHTIRNACGLMGLLHAVSNGPAKGFIGEHISRFSLMMHHLLILDRTKHAAVQVSRVRCAAAAGREVQVVGAGYVYRLNL